MKFLRLAFFVLPLMVTMTFLPAMANTQVQPQVAGIGASTLERYRDIVIHPQAPPVVRDAAKDLQYHLQKITGRSIPLVQSQMATVGAGFHFFVGSGVVPEQDAAIAALPVEGWMIKSVPNGLLLAGYEKNLSLTSYHAVSLFLEKHCGVHWLWPGESGEVIPHNPHMAIPVIDESGAPQLKRRKIDFYYGRFWNQEAKDDLESWKERVRFGDQLRANFGHAWGALIPGEIYFDEHPEWFGLVDGKRVPLQICPSNLQLRDEFVKRLLSLPANEKLDIVSVSASDGYGFCECELCQAKGTNQEDYKNEAYWDLVNDVAQRVKALRPNLGVGTFAYTISRNPPKKINKLPDNVYLSMTTYATQMVFPEERAKYEAFVRGWEAKGVKIIMREYWGTHYWMDLPVLYPDGIAATFNIAQDAMIGTYGEGGKNFSTMAPNYYVLTHLMWDPRRKHEEILDEFYAAFGPAAKSVRTYFELLQQETAAGWRREQIGIEKGGPGYSEVIANYGNIYTPAVMSQAKAYLDEAEGAAGNDKDLKRRIDFLRAGAEYSAVMGELLALYTKLGRTGFPLEALEWTATAAPRRLVTKSFDKFEGREFFEKQHAQPFTFTMAEKDEWLKRAWELGQKRIGLYNQNRKTFNFAIDEGLYAQTLEGQHHHTLGKGIRRWHQTVAHYLGKPESEIALLDYTPPAQKK